MRLLQILLMGMALLVTLLGSCDRRPSPSTQSPTDSRPESSRGSTSPVGSIAGTVTVKGTVPARETFDPRGDRKCLALHRGEKIQSDSLVVTGDRLQWVLVSVSDARGSGSKPPRALLDQQGCRYTPHVLGLMVGQELEIRNSDPFLHNIHPLPKVNGEFNLSQVTKGVSSVRKFDRAEPKPFKVKCNVHKWMSAWVAVFDHPYFAVTNEQGEFKIDKVPAGSYTLEAWHEKLGAQTVEVQVESGTNQVSFSFMLEEGRSARS